MKTIKKGTIKKSALLTCTFALAGVAPSARGPRALLAMAESLAHGE